MFKPTIHLPEVSRDPLDILNLFGPQSLPLQRQLQRILGTTKWVLGADLEYREPEKYREEPTVLGVSDGHLTISVPFEEGLPFFEELRRKHPNILFVGHAFTSADKFAFRQVGIEIANEDIEDTIIRFYLCNSHLCKSGQKVEDGDGAKRGRGFMNLWTFLSLYTDYPNYKEMFTQGIPWEGEKLDVWQYNGMDSLCPLSAITPLVTQSRLRKVDKLYPLHRELTYVLGEMTRYGVQIDREYVGKLQGNFEAEKERISSILPFNPRSSKEAILYFKEKKGIELKDWQEETIRKKVEEESDEELALSLDFKELGNGTDRWFAPVQRNKSGDWEGYMDSGGKIHPRIGIFTSTGRAQCTSPNLQNVSIRRTDRHTCTCGKDISEHPGVGHPFSGISLGRMVRKAIIASPGFYLLKADISNGENRVILHLGGHRIPDEIDLHLMVVKLADLTPDMEFSIRMGGPRQAAKSIAHATHYLEGLQLKYPKELNTPRIKSEISQGARLVFPDWTFNGKVVTFTGANLAQRAFGDKSFKNRAKALEVSVKYYTGFPGVRELQKRVMKEIERNRMVVTPHGYTLLSFGEDEDRCKTAMAMVGSNPVAHVTKLALVDLWKKFKGGVKLRPILQIHDEILNEVPHGVEPRESAEWLRESMEVETPEIPGLKLRIGNPSKGELASWGPNWDETKAIKI